jgi:hypothetical protein
VAIRRLGVPMGTRLEMITQHVDCWRIWTALKSKQVPPEQYVGTYLEIRQDGSVWQGGNDDEYEVMEPRV